MNTVFKRRLQAFIFAAGTLLSPLEASAGDARGYVALPDGTAGLLFYAYHRTGSDAYADGHKVNNNADYDMNLQIVRPAYYKEVGGFMTSIQALLPFGDVSSPVAGTRYHASGLADPTLILMGWPVANKEKKLWFAVSEFITVPLGSYDKNRPLNMGANRFGFKTEASLVKGFGDFYIDLTPSVEFFTDNSDHFAGGSPGHDLSTEPLYRFETHLSYDFTKSFMLSFDYYYEGGGAGKVDGGASAGEKDNHAVQLTAGIRFNPQHQILLQYMHDVKVENGVKRDQLGLRYFYTF